MAGKVGALWVSLGFDDTQFRSGVKSTVSTAQKSTALIQANFSTLNFRTFLYGAAGVYAVKRAIEGLMSPALDLEENLAKVSTVLDKAAMSHMPKYREQLQSMAKEFGQSTETLSTGLREILGSVIAPEKAMGVLREASKAATAGLTDTATATNALVTILKSYGMQAEESARVNDILFAAILRGRGTYEEWAGSIGVVASSAALAGLKVEELAAMMAVMTRQGLSADMATISLANMLNSFIKPSEDSAKAARKFGVELNTTTLRAIGMVGVMQRLKGATEEELAAIFPNIRGFRGMATAIQDLTGFTEDYAAIMKSTGSTEEALAKITATFKFQLKQFGQIILANFVIPFTEALIPSLRLTTKEMMRWAEQNREVIKLKLTEWAIRVKGAFEAIVATARALEKWFKAIEVIFVLLFAQTVINRAISFGTTLMNLTSLLHKYAGTLGLATVAETALGRAQTARAIGNFAGTAKGMQSWLGKETVGKVAGGAAGSAAGTIGAGAGVLGLFALEMGGAIYIGVKGIAEQLDKIDRMKFTDVKAMTDATSNMITLASKTDVQVFVEAFTKAAKEGKSFMDTWNLFLESTKGVDYAKTFGATQKTLMQMGYGVFQRALIKPKAVQVGVEAEDEKYMKHRRNMDLQEKDMKYWADREKGWNEQRIENEKSVADETLRLRQDSLYARAELIKDDTERALKMMDIEKQAYMEDLKFKYEGMKGYRELTIAAERYYANVEVKIHADAAARSMQAWENFKGHFSSILGRMVNEGELSAKAIGDAFVAAFRRIAIEEAATYAVKKGFDWARTLPVIGAILGTVAGVGPTLGAAAGTYVGGLVGKPAYSLPQGGVRGANNTDNSDNSNVNIYINASSDDLRNLDPYKFAKLYKEAKRSQLLAG